MKSISVIGSGFSGMASAAFLAKAGHKVTVFEKNNTVGGRARAFSESGFLFDMGPSWYWMPDVFEKFFANFDRRPQDYYNLVQLDPGFQIYFGKGDVMQIPASMDGIYDLFERTEKGAADKLRDFMKEGRYKYDIGMSELVYRPSFSWSEFLRYDVIKGAARLHVLRSVRSHVHHYFRDERLIALMEFPSLFLGAMAHQIPALYTLMNYAALSMGTWYPMGGMVRIAEAMQELAAGMGVDFRLSEGVHQMEVHDNKVKGLHTAQGRIATDGVVAAADYHHVEQALLPPQYRNYNDNYWEGRTMAPSCMLFYIGVGRKVEGLIHHNLFFDRSIDTHAKEIYEDPRWPSDPLFYICCPSKTDPSVAPAGMENLFVLIPVAPGLEDTGATRAHYLKIILNRLREVTGEDIEKDIVFNRSYCINDFVADYNAYRGNAYGLANTLRQTAVLKPTLRNKKLSNLFYAGQLTVPGPGVPPALISGQIAAEQLLKTFKSKYHETIV